MPAVLVFREPNFATRVASPRHTRRDGAEQLAEPQRPSLLSRSSAAPEPASQRDASKSAMPSRARPPRSAVYYTKATRRSSGAERGHDLEYPTARRCDGHPLLYVRPVHRPIALPSVWSNTSRTRIRTHPRTLSQRHDLWPGHCPTFLRRQGDHCVGGRSDQPDNLHTPLTKRCKLY